MAVPKRKHSRSRRNKKRGSNYVLKKPTLAKCGHCNEPIVSHRICPSCGYYGGVEVLQVDED